VRLNRKRLDQRAVDVRLAAWPRIISGAHARTPVGAGFSSSRFSSPSGSFRVLYAAEDFPTAFAEAVVRDRFDGKQRRVLFRPYLDTLMVTAIGSTAPLRLFDLTAGGAYELGIDTDASRARAHTQGQAFSQALHDETAFDGVLFDSRLTTKRCIAIYDRAFGRLKADTPIELLRIAALPAELKRLDITVRRRRGTSP
jgi:hypothetical protein